MHLLKCWFIIIFIIIVQCHYEEASAKQERNVAELFAIAVTLVLWPTKDFLKELKNKAKKEDTIKAKEKKQFDKEFGKEEKNRKKEEKNQSKDSRGRNYSFTTNGNSNISNNSPIGTIGRKGSFPDEDDDNNNNNNGSDSNSPSPSPTSAFNTIRSRSSSDEQASPFVPRTYSDPGRNPISNNPNSNPQQQPHIHPQYLPANQAMLMRRASEATITNHNINNRPSPQLPTRGGPRVIGEINPHSPNMRNVPSPNMSHPPPLLRRDSMTRGNNTNGNPMNMNNNQMETNSNNGNTTPGEEMLKKEREIATLKAKLQTQEVKIQSLEQRKLNNPGNMVNQQQQQQQQQRTPINSPQIRRPPSNIQRGIPTGNIPNNNTASTPNGNTDEKGI